MTPPAGSTATEALVIFTPSGRRGRFPKGTTVLDAASLARRRHRLRLRRARHLRPLPGDAGPRRVPEARDHLGAGSPVAPVRRPRSGLPGREGPGRRPAAVLHGHGARGRPDRRPAGEPGPPPGRAQGPGRPRLHVDPVVRLHYVEVTPPELASPTGDLARLFEALEREWELTDLDADLAVIRALQPALEAGKYGVTVAVHDGRQVIGRLAGPPRAALRRRDRRRIHDDRRPPGRPGRRRGPRQSTA